MAIVKRIHYGAMREYGSSGTTFNTAFGLDASTDAIEVILCFPNNGGAGDTITKIGFLYGTRTGTPPTYKVSIQGVDSSGLPDGVIKGGASPASKTFTPPADTTWNNLWQWITLDNAYAISPGEIVAIVIAYDSGTVNGSNFSSFTTDESFGSVVRGFPYLIQNNAGSRTRLATNGIFGLASANHAYGNIVQTHYAPTFTSATTPDEFALAFSIPVGVCAAFSCGGVKAKIGPTGAGSVKIQLYEGTTVLQTKTWDTDHFQGSAVFRLMEDMFFSENPLAVLKPGTVYRIGFQPQTAVNLIPTGIVVAAASDLDCYPGGADFFLSTRTDGGAWTDVPATRPFIEPILYDMSGGAIPILGGALVQ